MINVWVRLICSCSWYKTVENDYFIESKLTLYSKNVSLVPWFVKHHVWFMEYINCIVINLTSFIIGKYDYIPRLTEQFVDR